MTQKMAYIEVKVADLPEVQEHIEHLKERVKYWQDVAQTRMQDCARANEERERLEAVNRMLLQACKLVFHDEKWAGGPLTDEQVDFIKQTIESTEGKP